MGVRMCGSVSLGFVGCDAVHHLRPSVRQWTGLSRTGEGVLGPRCVARHIFVRVCVCVRLCVQVFLPWGRHHTAMTTVRFMHTKDLILNSPW